MLMPLTWMPTPFEKMKAYLFKILTFTRILIICYVMTVSVPSNPCALSLLHRVDEGLHALAVSRVWLHEVDDVEPVCLPFPRVLDSEVVPLSETSSSVVVLQIEIVFEFAPKMMFI